MHRRFAFALLICACAYAGTADAAHADDPALAAWVNEVKLGVLYHDMDGLWSGFRREDGIDINGEIIFAPKLDILWGSIRPVLGGSFNTAGDTSKAYADLRYQYEHGSGAFFGFGLGGAVHDGELHDTHEDRKALGTRFLFHTSLEAGYRFAGRHALSVYFDHISNASIGDENQGLDTLGLRYGYRLMTASGP